MFDPPSSITTKADTAKSLPHAKPRSIEFELYRYTGIFLFLASFCKFSSSGQLLAIITI